MESEVEARDNNITPLLLLISQQMSQVLRRHDELETRVDQLHQKLDKAVALEEMQYRMVQQQPLLQPEPSVQPAEHDDAVEWLADLFHVWCCGGCYSHV